MGRSEAAEFNDLQGKTLVKIERVTDEVLESSAPTPEEVEQGTAAWQLLLAAEAAGSKA